MHPLIDDLDDVRATIKARMNRLYDFVVRQDILAGGAVIAAALDIDMRIETYMEDLEYDAKNMD